MVDENAPPVKKITTHGGVINYFWQSIVAIIYVWLAMIGFDVVHATRPMWVLGVAVLSTSAVYVFAMPNTTPAHPLRILGGYLIGLVAGIGFEYLFAFITSQPSGEIGQSYHHLFEVGGFIAFIVTMLIMVGVRSEHPPAAALALLLTVEDNDYSTISIIIIGAILLALLRFIFGRQLKDLIW